MKLNRRNHTEFVLVALTLIVLCVMLCACSQTEESDVVERKIYLTGGIVFTSVEDDTAYVHVSFSGDGECVGTATWSSEIQNVDLWYKQSTSTVTFDPSRIFSAVKEAVPQEDLKNEDHIYNRLKVVLLYDTIYKSIKSDGQITKNGRTYTHAFELDETLDERTITLTMRSARSENWYTALIAGGIVLFVIATGIYLAYKGRLCQKKKLKE